MATEQMQLITDITLELTGDERLYIREYYIRASESLKQLHKRVDRIDKIIDESHPHQYIEE